MPDFQKAQLHLAALSIPVAKPSTGTDADERLLDIIGITMPGVFIWL
jgi:hypothetical protein